MKNKSWVLYDKSHPKISQLVFQREIVETWLKKYGTAPKIGGRPSTSKFSLSGNRINDDVRYDATNHLVVQVPGGKRRRCAGEGCSSVGRTMCEKCDLGMCIQCFKIFHTKTFGL